MRPKRFFYLMVACLVLLGAMTMGAAVGGNALLKKQSAKLNDLKLQDRVLQEQQTLLVQAKKDIEKYGELDTIAKTIVPQDKDQAKTIRTLASIAEQSGIKLQAISFPTSSLGQAAAGTKQPAAAVPAPTQAKPVQGIPGVYALEITIGSDEEDRIPYRRFLDFLERLENSRRTAHVERITIKPSPDGSTVSFTLTLNAYLKP